MIRACAKSAATVASRRAGSITAGPSDYWNPGMVGGRRSPRARASGRAVESEARLACSPQSLPRVECERTKGAAPGAHVGQGEEPVSK